jgi:hypothetical protein
MGERLLVDALDGKGRVISHIKSLSYLRECASKLLMSYSPRVYWKM